MIQINFDFVDGTELSYMEGVMLKDNFTTNCLDFFSFSTKAENVRVVNKGGGYIDLLDLIENNGYTAKEIRVAHDIQKILKAGGFKFKYDENV